MVEVNDAISIAEAVGAELDVPGAMTQAFIWRANNNISTGTVYSGLCSGRDWTATQSAATHPWCVAGRFRRLKIRLASAPGSGKSVTFTVLINGSATSLACTVSGTNTEAENTVDVASVADGDTVTLRSVGSGSPTVSIAQVYVEFRSDAANASGYGTAPASDPGTNSNRWCALFGPRDGWWFGPGYSSVAAFDQTVTKLRVALTTAPGVGNSITFLIAKNGTRQDGTGGTVDTQVTISGTATTGVATFSLDVVPGDLVDVRQYGTSGTPSSPGAVRYAVAVAPDTNGEFQLDGFISSISTATSASYASPAAQAATLQAAEANALATLGSIDLRLKGLYTDTSNTLGGNGILCEVIVAGGASTFSLTHTATSHSDTGDETVAADSTLSLRFTGQGGGGFTRPINWGLRLDATEPTPTELNVDVSETITVAEAVTAHTVSEIDLLVFEAVSVVEPTLSPAAVDPNPLLLRVEVIAVTESVTVQLSLTTSQADAVTVTEVVTLDVWDTSRTEVNDAVTITESVTAVLNDPAAATPVETVAVAEDVQVLLQETISLLVYDEVTVAEDVKPVITPLTVIVFDAVGVAEINSLPISAPLAYEVIRIAESVTVMSPTLAVQVFETITVTEAPLNQGTTGLSPEPTPLPGATLQDYWDVGIT